MVRGGGGGGKMISRFNDSETKKRETFTPGFHLSNLELLCALLSRKERRSGGKAVEERAPPRNRGGKPEFRFRMLGQRVRTASTKWSYWYPDLVQA